MCVDSSDWSAHGGELKRNDGLHGVVDRDRRSFDTDAYDEGRIERLRRDERFGSDRVKHIEELAESTTPSPGSSRAVMASASRSAMGLAAASASWTYAILLPGIDDSSSQSGRLMLGVVLGHRK